jgi:hypothetical protein
MEDDPDRTLVWRPAGSSATSRPPDTTGERLREPVRAGDTTTNVNQPSSGWRPPIAPTATQLAVWRAQRIIYYVFGIIQAFIAVRFILKLLSANPTSPFTQFIYNISWVFVFPFNGVVPDTVVSGSVFEWFTLISLVVYALVSVALAKLIGLLV